MRKLQGVGAHTSSGRAGTPADRQPSVAQVVGSTIASLGVEDAFGVLGSGNLILTNSLCAHGARFHHARHEGGAVCMADAMPAPRTASACAASTRDPA